MFYLVLGAIESDEDQTKTDLVERLLLLGTIRAARFHERKKMTSGHVEQLVCCAPNKIGKGFDWHIRVCTAVNIYIGPIEIRLRAFIASTKGPASRMDHMLVKSFFQSGVWHYDRVACIEPPRELDTLRISVGA